MDILKSRVAGFFDSDSAEYLAHKYGQSRDSFMALRREKAAQVLQAHVVPTFNEQFRFLDCGCGPGILLDILSRYRVHYSGIDISEQMLQLARTQSADRESRLASKELVRGDVESLPFQTGSFDAVASLGVIEYLEGDDRLLSEILRVVKPGGFVLIAVTNKFAYNLLLEKPLNVLRRNRGTAAALDAVKRGLGLGRFRQMEFVMRRHSPRRFAQRIAGHDVRIIATASWGFNLLPHPLHHLSGRRLNSWANRFYERGKPEAIEKLGEGYMVLCQRN